MATFLPLSDTYATRRNTPVQDNSSALNIRRSILWSLKAHLKNEISTGTLAGSRSSNSVWTHVESSDSVTTSTSVDLWGSTFDASKLVFNTDSWPSFTSPQSWIVLQNTAIGYQICISCSYSPNQYAGVTFTPISNPFTGGTATTRPNATNRIAMHERDYGYGWGGFFTDLTVGGFFYTHFVTNATDGQYWFLVSRGGTGIFNHLHGFQKTVDNSAGDTRNVFALSSAYASGRGAGLVFPGTSVGFVASRYSFDGQHSNGTQITGTYDGGMGPTPIFGEDYYAGSKGLDSISSYYSAFPTHAMTFNPTAYRGRFPDLYSIGTAPVGASIPESGPGQQRIVVGDVVIPFIGGSPNL